MDSHRLHRKPTPMVRTTKTKQKEGMNSCFGNQEQTRFLNNVVSSPQNFNPCPNNSDSGTLKDKRHSEKGEKAQGTSETGTETPQSASKGGCPCTCRWYERCKNILQDKLEAMRKKKPENKNLLKEKQHKELEEFCPIVTFVPDKLEKTKKAGMQKSNARNAQSKKQKKRGTEEAKMWCPIRKKRPKPLHLSTAILNEVSGKDKHDEQFKRPLSCKKEQKLIVQVDSLTENAEEQVVMQWQKYKSVSEDIRSEYVHDEREKNVPEKVTFQERCKKMVYDNLEDIRRQEDVKEALEEKKLYKDMAKQEFAQKLLDKQEREKKVKMQKSLTDAWDAQVEYKRQKMEMDKIKKQASYSLMESELLHRMEEIEKKEKQRKFHTEDETEQNMRDQMIAQCEIYQSVGDPNEGFQSKSVFVQHKSERKLPEKVPSQEESKKENKEKVQKCFKQNETEQNTEDQVLMQWETYQSVSESELEWIQNKTKIRLPEKLSSLEECKKIVYDNLEDLKRKEAANYSLLEDKQRKERAKLQLGQKLQEELEREKKANLRRSLTDAWDAQIRYKQQKKKEISEIERQRMAAIMESDRLHQTDISLKHQYNQQKKGAERQGLLPRSDRLQNKTKKYMDNKDVMQWEMYHSVTEQGRDVQYESGFLDYESDCDIPDKDRSREIRKKIVYDQLSLIKKEEAKKRAFMEDKSLREMKHRESAERKREKLEKEKKAAAIKSLTDSWDSQIRFKQQQKKELREIERKDMLSLIELERVCESQKNKRTQLQKHKQAVYHEVQETLAEARSGRSCSKSYVRRSVYSGDKHDTKTSNVHRPLLSRQKVSNTSPVRFPSLNSNSVHLPENCQQQFALSNESDINADLKTRQFPSIHSPK